MAGLLSLQDWKFPVPYTQTCVLHKLLTVDQAWKEGRERRRNDRKLTCHSSLMTRSKDIITQVREVLREGSHALALWATSL